MNERGFVPEEISRHELADLGESNEFVENKAVFHLQELLKAARHIQPTLTAISEKILFLENEIKFEGSKEMPDQETIKSLEQELTSERSDYAEIHHKFNDCMEQIQAAREPSSEDEVRFIDPEAEGHYQSLLKEGLILQNIIEEQRNSLDILESQDPTFAEGVEEELQGNEEKLSDVNEELNNIDS